MRPHHVQHKLQAVEFRLVLPNLAGSTPATIRASGRSDTKRGDLWTYVEAFDEEIDRAKGYGAADALHHISLVALQDRPNTMDRLDFALRGGLAWHQESLF